MCCCQAFVAIALLTATAASAKVVFSTSYEGLQALPPRHLPWIGNGTCAAPIYDTKTRSTFVSCIGPKQLLAPGQTEDVMATFASPFPAEGQFVILNQTSQLVDDDLKPVPLYDTYVHHYGGNPTFIGGSGAELRGQSTRKPLPLGYHLVANGSQAAPPEARLTNIQLINTVGLPLQHAKRCLECWCDDHPFTSTAQSNLSAHQHAHSDRGDPTYANEHPQSLQGSLLCCKQCPSTSNAGPKGYHIQYNVTFRPFQEQDKPKGINYIFFDVVNGDFEYQITEAKGPNSTHVQEFDTVYDWQCPQKQPFQVLRCTAHQHFGGQCIDLINLDKNETICSSCPRFGTRWGVPGDELGYVVRIEDDDLIEPYTIEPGTHVRIRSKYDASVPRFGVMGLMFTWVAGLPEPCIHLPNVSSIVPAAGPDGSMTVPLYGHGMMPYQPHFPVKPAADVVMAS